MKKIQKQNISDLYDKYYKISLYVPVAFFIICFFYIGSFYTQTGSLFYKDVSLAGGTSLTLTGITDTTKIEEGLSKSVSDVSFRKVTDMTSGEQTALIIESSVEPEILKQAIMELGFELKEENSNIEFTGSSLSNSFNKQLLTALVFSFILMACVIFVLFRTFVPSIAVIFAAFGDIVMTLAVLNFFSVKISAAGIAAFLMLVGYSVDTDILLTTRALKKKEGTLNKRIFGAFKTGIFMTITALAAVIPSFFFVAGLPESFKQIFLILGIGLSFDIINTWLTNASIIKWYCIKNGIN